MLPTIGLLVSSFRPRLTKTSGWWTALSPFEFNRAETTRTCSVRSNLGQAFFNSFSLVSGTGDRDPR